jgi:hypothetical protein
LAWKERAYIYSIRVKNWKYRKKTINTSFTRAKFFNTAIKDRLLSRQG